MKISRLVKLITKKESVFALLGLLFTGTAVASGAVSAQVLDLTAHPVGYISLLIFAIAYGLVMAEEFTQLRKSKPVILAAGIMWLLVAVVYGHAGDTHTAAEFIRHNLVEYAELFLFLLAAMTYINAMDERQVFDALRSWLIRKGFGYRTLFWVTGWLAFFISPVADNLTTALLMCAVIMAVGADNPRFVGIGCINVVVAANAGGAFSPFGDITTLMVWQENIQTPQGAVDFWSFFLLFIPSVVNFVIPAAIMQMAVPNVKPPASDEVVPMKRGAKRIMLLFLATIITAVSFHNFFHLPPMLGMMTGLGYLQFFGYYLKKTHRPPLDMKDPNHDRGVAGDFVPFDVFNKIARAEWDTLLFFYGVIMCVGALSVIGYLAMASQFMYVEMGPTFANIMVGILSAIVDNIPVMFAVLTMEPEMSQGQWLLATLTAGVGGSMLSIGSAAGVALMGQARGKYTFFGHLKWTWAIALGYAASIMVHMFINKSLF
jgi:NhaD family Na+/H+ antiporter